MFKFIPPSEITEYELRLLHRYLTRAARQCRAEEDECDSKCRYCSRHYTCTQLVNARDQIKKELNKRGIEL